MKLVFMPLFIRIYKIFYRKHTYDSSKAISGVEVADFLGEDYNRTFKTLVTVRKIW